MVEEILKSEKKSALEGFVKEFDALEDNINFVYWHNPKSGEWRKIKA